eukprot:CFRG7254T1
MSDSYPSLGSLSEKQGSSNFLGKRRSIFRKSKKEKLSLDTSITSDSAGGSEIEGQGLTGSSNSLKPVSSMIRLSKRKSTASKIDENNKPDVDISNLDTHPNERTGPEVMENLPQMAYTDQGWPVCETCSLLMQDDMLNGRREKGMWCSVCQKYSFQQNVQLQLHLEKNRIIWLKAIKNAPDKFQRIDPWK